MTEYIDAGGIEYHGLPGVSRDCQEAVLRLLQCGYELSKARILSCANSHCLLLTNIYGDLIAIKSGFSSGYGGEGPVRFSIVLQLLESHGVEIDECEVQEAIIERLDRSALTTSDLQKLQSKRPVRPSRWHSYVFEDDSDAAYDGTLWHKFQPIMPFAIIDNRIVDLALKFWGSPDDILLTGYRRLEDIVRQRSDIEDHGQKLFSKAFGGTTPMLEWRDCDEGERAGRVSLFTGTYMAHRNPRAHRELQSDLNELLTEFLLLNHLYRLERLAHRPERATVLGG